MRPGSLTDDPATGRVAAGELDRGCVPRADVAAVLAAVLADPGTARLQFDLLGGDTPVAEALVALTRDS